MSIPKPDRRDPSPEPKDLLSVLRAVLSALSAVKCSGAVPQIVPHHAGKLNLACNCIVLFPNTAPATPKSEFTLVTAPLGWLCRTRSHFVVPLRRRVVSRGR